MTTSIRAPKTTAPTLVPTPSPAKSPSTTTTQPQPTKQTNLHLVPTNLMSTDELSFTINQDVFARLLALVSKAIPRNSATLNNFQVLNFILIEVLDDQADDAGAGNNPVNRSGKPTSTNISGGTCLRLSAYNGEFALQVVTDQFDTFTARPGKALLPTASLTQIITNLPTRQSVTIKLAEDSGTVLIECGSFKNSLRCYTPLDHFPRISSQFSTRPSPVLVQTKLLQKTISQVTFAAAAQENAPNNFHNICLKVGDKEMALIAVDGICLALRQIPISPLLPAQLQPYQVLLSSDTLAAIQPLLNPDEYQYVEMGLNERGSMLILKSSGSDKFKVIASLIEGKFPDYKAVIPREYRTRIVLNLEELARATRLAQVCLKNSSDTTSRWNFWLKAEAYEENLAAEGPGTLTVKALSPDGSSETPITILIEGENNEVSLQPTRLLDVLKAAEDQQQLVVEIEAANKPVVFKPYLQSATNTEKWLFLIVPLTKTTSSSPTPTKAIETGKGVSSRQRETQIEEVPTLANSQAENAQEPEESISEDSEPTAAQSTKEIAPVVAVDDSKAVVHTQTTEIEEEGEEEEEEEDLLD